MLTVDQLVKSFSEPARRERDSAKKPGRTGLTGSGATASIATIRPRVYAVDRVSFDVTEGEFFTLLGPSGCGKTTTLRSIAGLEQPDSGRITVDGRDLFDRAAAARRVRVSVPANERMLGMVFQSYAIWPHMTVFGNVAFPLQVGQRSKRLDRRAIKEKVDRVLAVMELEAYADRRATQLSGGQQQRLALARALVTEPRLLLLDEPLSNLDAKLRESLRFELKRLQRDLGITTIYVTHDQVEALALSSRIAVMRDGRIEQLGKPREIYEAPASEFVAQFIGTSNLLPGTVISGARGHWKIDTDVGSFESSADFSGSKRTAVILSIRPEAMEFVPAGGVAAPNELTGTVITRAFLGDAMDHVVDIGGRTFRVRSGLSDAVLPGEVAHLRVSPDAVTLVPAG